MASDEADDSHETDPRKADHYRHRDGTDEIVFAVEDGHVLAIREYRSVEDFRNAVEDAEFVGTHKGVEDLPSVEAFEEGDTPDE